MPAAAFKNTSLLFWDVLGLCWYAQASPVATSLVAEHRLQVLKLQQVRLAGLGTGFSCRVRRLFLDQGSNPCPLCSQADSCLLATGPAGKSRLLLLLEERICTVL